MREQYRTAPLQRRDRGVGKRQARWPRVRAAARAAPRLTLQAFPNPAPGAFSLRVTGPADARPLTLKVTSLLGQRVLVLHGSAGSLPAEISQRSGRLAPGTYLLRLSGADFSVVQRVVKL